jgi:LacI family transcriptional regulator
MRVWVRYAVGDSPMRSISAAIRHRAREIGGIECRLWTGISPGALSEGGWPPEAMILIGRSDRAEQDRESLDIPSVFIDVTPYDRKRRPSPDGWPVVGLNEDAIGRLAAEHLWKLGLRNFALLNQGWVGVQRPRSGGFVAWLHEKGATCTDLAEISGHRAFDDHDGPGPQRMVALLRDLPRPLALFATSDVLAELAVDWCRQSGLRVPQDIAVLGTGDDPLHAPHASVPLSSVHLPWWHMGQRALDTLIESAAKAGHRGAKDIRKRMGENLKPRPDGHRLKPVGVTVRASTNTIYTEDPVVHAFVEAVRGDHHCKLGVDALAHRLQVSPPTLYRRCRAVLGDNPSHHLQRVRIQHSVRLLRDTDWTLVDIAHRCGFADQAAFTRAFKRLTHMTPGDFRRH